MTGIHRLAREATRPAVGRDVEAWCGKCARVLDHVITAMVGLEVVQVRCQTCQGTHKFKTARDAAAAAAEPKKVRIRAPGEPKPDAKPKADPVEVRAARLAWTRSMAARDRASATAYSPSVTAELGLMLDHKQFGYGFVDTIMDGKCRVLFEDGFRVLVTGR